ncbi:MAG: alanine--tRNA ligase [Anaerolineae bacterium]
MKRMTSHEIRQAFLDFFAERGHQVVAASSLVPGNDPTLLFTNAGMVQFKDVFLGLDQRPYKRAATAQKCMRISGKHNDLENVGPSPRHHTFFEMLGNFSFGDYFKRDAIIYAYDLLTRVYGLPPDRLAFTVYETDDEAYRIWTEEVGVSPKRVARMGPKTNFWQMAETGPCGPTSEIHWDNHPELGEDSIIEALKREDDRFLELWNLVFMQFNRTQPDPTHSGQFDEPLPAPGVDTGMGLERIVAVMQGVEANYDTDLFTDIMDATQEILGHDDAFRRQHEVAYRVIADHTRGATFLIADGVNPGTTGREYVVRMLIRRAWRFAHKMGVEKPFLTDVSEAVIAKMGDVYPELRQFRKAIRYQIATEEEAFIRTLDRALHEFDDKLAEMEAKGSRVMSGEDAFFLHATHGLPLEITRDLLQERGYSVDEAGFRAAMEEHSRISGGEVRGFADVTVYQETLEALKAAGQLGPEGVEYNPYDYDHFERDTRVLAIIRDGQRVDQAAWDESEPVIELVLPATTFYVESGGQVSDTGVITSDGWEVEVFDMRQPVGGLIVHVGRIIYGGAVRVGDAARAVVNHHRRWDIMRNHTATHLLHASLRHVLGEHVRQKGSLVAPDLLRFDFSHNARLTREELDRITAEVNEMILANQPVRIEFKKLDEARQGGAMALFGEKYGETVRTITIPDPADPTKTRYSYELCGGTHVRSTGDIGPFVITKEESSSAGVRRIVAVTGHAAQTLITGRMKALESMAERLGADPETLGERVEALLDELRQAHRTIAELTQSQAGDVVRQLVGQARQIDGATVLAAHVTAADDEMLGWMVDRCREHIQSGVVVLGAEIEGKARLVVKVTPDLVQRGIRAGEVIKQIAGLVGGGGGGRPDFATAGGKNPAGLPDAIARAEELVEAGLKA